MNDTINKLSEKAKEYAREHVLDCKTYGYHTEDNEFELKFEEKFAELLIKECGSVVENVRDQGIICRAAHLQAHFGEE